MSTGDGIYYSVRLFCCTILLIALLQWTQPFTQLWVFYQLKKSERPQVETPTMRGEAPALRDQREKL
jgi:hypothetical protein